MDDNAPPPVSEIHNLYAMMKAELAMQGWSMAPGDRVALLVAMADLAIGLANAEAAVKLAAEVKREFDEDDEEAAAPKVIFFPGGGII